MTEHGFATELAASGEDAVRLATVGGFDLILLDLNLPRMNGWLVMTELRRENIGSPVLLMTAHDAARDRKRAVELGAVDCLAKPFGFSELLARVWSILPRESVGPLRSLRVADLEIDLALHRATRGGMVLDLTPKEFTLLALLLRYAGVPVPPTVIAAQVWKIDFANDSEIVDAHMRRLQLKVDGPFDRNLIHRVRGLGYTIDDKP